MASLYPSRGDIVQIDFDPIEGHEQGGRRPALVVSNDIMNHSRAELLTVVPLTTKSRPLRSYLKVEPPEGGLPRRSYIICDQIRTVSARRLSRILGKVHSGTMAEVEDRLRVLLDL